MKKIATILFHYFQAKRRMRFSPEKLRRWQKRHTKKIHAFAQHHSPFYSKHLGAVISKKEMMENFSSFNTRGIGRDKALSLATLAEESREFGTQLERLTVGLSSGTSGNRGLFLLSEDEQLSWCGNVLAKVLPEPPWKKQKIAFFLRANSRLYETVGSKSLEFSFFDLLEDIEVLKQKLCAFDPDVLVAPPSMLLLLIGTCRPGRVISVAETLFSSDQERLEKGFKQPVHQVYQCTEGFLGFTCTYGTIHLNEDLVLIEKEYIDETRFIPIITDLFRTTQPIIRYRLNDVLEEKKGPCPCGCSFQALERIEGRSDDVLYVRGKNGTTTPLFPDFVSRRILSASPLIEEYEVVQTSLDLWMIYVEPIHKEAVSIALGALFDKMECEPPELNFLDKPLPRKRGDKLRRIKRSYENTSTL